VVSGPGGAGKGTVIRRLVERNAHLWLSRSWTTRARRANEDESAYTFVSRDTFLENVRKGGFLEWATVLEEYYGTPIPSPPEGKDVVLEIDVQGAEQVLKACTGVVCVLLVPPSQKDQELRLRGRGDSEDHVKRRLALGEQEVSRAKAIADAIVVNDDVDRAAMELQGILEQAHRKADA
jgi:guanylate kinase